MNWFKDNGVKPFVFLGRGFSCEQKPILAFPEEVFTTNRRSEVLKIIRKIEDKVSEGFFAAGWISYESGDAFLKGEGEYVDSSFDFPLVWFGTFQEYKSLEKEELASWENSFSAEGYSIRYKSSINFDKFEDSIHKIKQSLRNGDGYQINYTFPLELNLLGSSGRFFFDLRKAQDVPYEAWIYTGREKADNVGREILSFSPELFWERTGKIIRTSPMKGTRPRGKNAEEDLRFRTDLQDSEKDRAENLMITDLIRSDLGKISELGSVSVQNLFGIQEYSTVFQMTSDIGSVLSEGVSFSKILEALFPGGSITGAPKRRATEIISSLEGSRGIYTGAIAFLSPGQETVSIPIRTLEFQGDFGDGRSGRFGIGAGITIDSDPEEEWKECWSKAAFLTESVREIGGNFEIFTTARAKRGTVYFEKEHEERMRNSAKELGFTFPDQEWKSILEKIKIESSGNAKNTYRVRISLDRKLGLKFEMQLWPSAEKEGRILISNKRLRNNETLRLHKTSVRTAYLEGYESARSKGYLDAVFTDEEARILEGSIHSIFLRIGGKWFTPSLQSCILPGIARKKLMIRLKAREKDLFVPDFREAERIILCNALRGIRLVTSVDLE
ncbi:bifunctional aminodeoxychorismate synthase component I/aminotransferase [Leptospira fletcheri]|uniref:Bifunctional aminodeoxychorismate synthase component I/aminotransferase n=1 Tax=Leptospira fletcheri TaxID=2484981 RepID=A0A4R9GHK2_9LEPT|nr:bifunctional chorismate-binding protein/class IV aminotransferase [Leptospira fletcheri]TGK11606.1 bifunctional aminodeoxychorismate synthase component I/aminotransferase [Leptospira fletcheri]